MLANKERKHAMIVRNAKNCCRRNEKTWLLGVSCGEIASTHRLEASRSCGWECHARRRRKRALVFGKKCKNEKDEKKEKTKTINVDITSTHVIVKVANSRDKKPVEEYERKDSKLRDKLTIKLQGALEGRTEDEQRVVAVMCKDDSAPYFLWMNVTDAIEQAGGIITLVREEVVNVQ